MSSVSFTCPQLVRLPSADRVEKGLSVLVCINEVPVVKALTSIRKEAFLDMNSVCLVPYMVFFIVMTGG